MEGGTCLDRTAAITSARRLRASRGQLTMNNIDPVINAALDGVGLSYAPKDLVRQHLESGRLQEVLADWAPTFQGYHLYYPSRRHRSPAFAAFVEAFRYRQR
ncbi:LysR substrate-binding domain-containing protein [Sinorhizobium meliloti]|uniref:LysR substrate-binding domain-containing protein n=1 Tax=Rhizobium meliloti TaxID=382 RepID=UPI0022778993|nr:LysR substrate-binding domain-containing protein [Sinorhizobium meliloti]